MQPPHMTKNSMFKPKPTMKKNTNLILCLTIAAVLVYVACRKTDRQITKPVTNEIDLKFFFTNTSSNPLVQAISGFMQRQNYKYNFTEYVTNKIGYPHWDDAVVFENVRTFGSKPGTEDSSSVVYIPFVIDTQNHVNTTLMFKMNPSDTVFQYVSDWQYKNFSFDTIPINNTWKALDIFNIFMKMDHSVFGDTDFVVTDGRILGLNKDTMRTVSISNTTGKGNVRTQYGKENLLSSFTFCHTVSACVYVGPTQRMGKTATPIQPCFCHCNYTTFCTTIWVDIPTGGTGGGGTGGG